MRAYLHIFLFVLMGLGAKAQQNYFVYMQADNKQPFYVKVNDKLLSSSESGYMVIPKLISGDYTLTVGFPKNIFPEQTLALTIANADAGYLLKNYGDKGWGLVNIQTMAVTMSGAAPVKQPSANDDAFTNVLSGVSNSAPPAVKPVVEDPVKPAATAVSALSVIQRIGSTDAPEGRSYIYTDRNGERTDTISIFLPPPAVVQTEPASQTTATADPAKDRKFLDIELPNPNTKPAVADTVVTKETPVATVSADPVKQADKPVVSFNSDCRANANDDDFLKIRKKMAAEKDDDAMVHAAAKMLKQKCYSTEQVKNLSLLFLSDAGKYQFFEAAYPHTYDTQNFRNLQAELHDTYYINRFKAMLRN